MRRPSARMFLTAAAAASAAIALVNQKARGKTSDLRTASTGWRSHISSHETFSHDSLDSLGYDWSRIADPEIAPKHPLKVYLPQTTEEVVRIIREAKTLGERPTIRSKGHSSNGLVLNDRGSLILTEKMSSILEVNERDLTATVQGGAISAQIDDHLATKGLGLPIIGDHIHITVGGFSSVGGISPASHRHGLFLDNVLSLEYVDWDGEVHQCSRTESSEHFHKVLAGLGQHGLITKMTLRIIEIDKYGAVLENDQSHYRTMEAFIEGSAEYIRNPGDMFMERGLWIDFPLPSGKSVSVGQFSAYHETEYTRLKQLRNWGSYGYLHGIGFFAGRLPSRKADQMLKYLGMVGVVLSPKFASIKNVEFFTDKILDSTVGDPTRMLIVLGPLDRYEELFRSLWGLMEESRRRYRCFTFLSVYVKSIRSEYLGEPGRPERFCELMFYFGINPEGMSDATLDEIVSEFDDICIANGAYRYMHSKTVDDEERRAKIDPNWRYSHAAVPSPR